MAIRPYYTILRSPWQGGRTSRARLEAHLLAAHYGYTILKAAALHVHAVLDPLSEMARWAAPLLVALRAQLKLSLTVDNRLALQQPRAAPCNPPCTPSCNPLCNPLYHPPCSPARPTLKLSGAPRWSSRRSPSYTGCRSRASTGWRCSSSRCAPRRPPRPSISSVWRRPSRCTWRHLKAGSSGCGP